MANKVSRRCPYCNAKITFDLESTNSAMECPHCGETVARKKFPLAEGRSVPLNIELENAKSLRAIAVSIQTLALSSAHEYGRDGEDGTVAAIMLDDLKKAHVQPFE